MSNIVLYHLDNNKQRKTIVHTYSMKRICSVFDIFFLFVNKRIVYICARGTDRDSTVLIFVKYKSIYVVRIH